MFNKILAPQIGFIVPEKGDYQTKKNGMTKAEIRYHEKTLLAQFVKAEKKMWALPPKERDRVSKLLISVANGQINMKHNGIWDARTREKAGIALPRDKKLLNVWRKKIRNFNSILDVIMHFITIKILFLMTKNGINLLEAASFMGKHMCTDEEPFTQEEFDSDFELIMRKKKALN